VRLYSYVIEHDYGFAPNPFHGVCSLACCKPPIRRTACIGDYVIGTGATKPKLLGHMLYWMKVDRIITFDDYWSDPQFRRKRAFMRGSRIQRFGDNIYHRDPATLEFIQEDSFHCNPGGVLSPDDLKRDTGTTHRILLANDFAYWGEEGPKIPAHLAYVVKKGAGYKCRFSEEQVQAFLGWLDTMPERGFIGDPAHWKYLKE
jgi:hypothetical protein